MTRKEQRIIFSKLDELPEETLNQRKYKEVQIKLCWKHYYASLLEKKEVVKLKAKIKRDGIKNR